MKKFLLIIATAAFAAGASAQSGSSDILDAYIAASDYTGEEPVVEAEPSNWLYSASFDLGYQRTNLTSWAAGGYDANNFTTAMDAQANYSKGLTSWGNRLQLDYGFFYSEDKPVAQKSADRIYLESTYKYKTSENSKWNYSAAFDFKSQFTDSYKYVAPEDGSSSVEAWKKAAQLQSAFLAPAYSTISVGMDWAGNDWISVSISPLTGGFTITTREELRKNYGMELKKEFAGTENPTNDMYRSARFQFGAQMKANFRFTINDSFKFDSQLVLFSDYLHDPQNLRVNFDTQASWQLSRFIKLAFKTWLIYDPNVLVANDAGELAHRVQFKDHFSINVTYTFKR